MSSNLYATIHEATRLNHEGVRCLGANDSQSAHRLFKQALAAINSSLANDIYEGDDEKSSHPRTIPTLALPIAGMEDDLFYVHSQALVVDFSVFGPSSSTLHIASTVILFNLALSCHKYGMQYSAEPNLRSASRLYGLCSNLVNQQLEESETFSAADDLASLVAFAALNNKAQIHFRYLVDPQGAVDILKTLKPTEAILSIESPFLEPAHLEAIMLNRFTLAGSALLPSAAAA
ncbi:expressed unknown protein [Seminavis robusta]|uniref:Uncharacterized protein n=1 Tax=Seminavis robusta TaxID=568900 RepID=A0A9N8F0A8_9STRA|nr:expressed unknown protein [Seminavis robusta]CAB9531337.1 expressed unknown protein [Seminavis robusta]|eukprot:Sro2413_g326730.1 n/a (233) ;mRNA; f:387-1085